MIGWVLIAGIVCCPARYAGDVNSDGEVDALDLLRVNSCWGDPCCCDADINRDGAVDAVDLLIVLDDWGRTL